MNWREALFARRTLGVRFGLDAIKAVDRALGQPCAGLPLIHLVGTNGKGSTAAMASQLLVSSGKRVGLYTSPHLHRVGERVRIDGEPVDDEVIQRATERVTQAENVADRELSFFEVLTLAALCAFAERGVQVVVLEAGLGGRLDATRVRTPTVTLVTRIGLDHQAYLGDSLEAIAGEKAAVMRAGAPCFSVDQEAGVWEVLRAAAEEVGTSLVRAEALASETPLAGAHQAENAGLALAGVRVLDPDICSSGLEGTHWPARLESLDHQGGTVVLDVAHNLDGVDALVRHAQTAPPDLVVFGCMGDKPLAPMVSRLAELERPLWLVAPPVDGAADFAAAPSVGPRAVVRSLDDAFWSDLALTLRGGKSVLVCGSHFLVAPVRARILGLDPDAPNTTDPPELSDPVLRE